MVYYQVAPLFRSLRTPVKPRMRIVGIKICTVWCVVSTFLAKYSSGKGKGAHIQTKDPKANRPET